MSRVIPGLLKAQRRGVVYSRQEEEECPYPVPCEGGGCCPADYQCVRSCCGMNILWVLTRHQCSVRRPIAAPWTPTAARITLGNAAPSRQRPAAESSAPTLDRRVVAPTYALLACNATRWGVEGSAARHPSCTATMLVRSNFGVARASC
jgi:hypothetical protein